MTSAPHLPFRRRLWREASGSWRTTLIVAGGFLLSLGWVWFNGVFPLVAAGMPKVFSGTLFSGGGVGIFAAALLSGFIVSGFALKRLALRNERLPAALAHGSAFVFMIAGALVGGAYPHAAAAFFGMGAAASGVYWTTRLVALRPVRAGTAMAFAALMMPLFALAIAGCPLTLVLPAGVLLAGGLAYSHGIPQSDGEGEALLHVAASDDAPVTANMAGWQNSPLRDDMQCAERNREHGGGAHSTLIPLARFLSREVGGTTLSNRDRHIMPLIALPTAFFLFGVLASSDPAPILFSLPVAAVGVAVATALWVRRRDGAYVMALLTVALVVPTALRNLLFPGLTGVDSFMDGMMEGAAIIAIACWRREKLGVAGNAIHAADFFGIGVCLAVVFVLVNAGGLVGGIVANTSHYYFWLMVAMLLALVPVAILVTVKWLARSPESADDSGPVARGVNQSLTGQCVTKEYGTGQSDHMDLAACETITCGVERYLSLHNLTSREREIALLMLRGRLTKEIGAELCISEHTVKTHVKNILKKFGLPHRKAFVSMCLLHLEKKDG